ncbi:MAG: hypothetical protein NW216_00490 [Hyphomicrobium sp.]|nr:hypothetical protein [Hyphomicrobium sp.]
MPEIECRAADTFSAPPEAVTAEIQKVIGAWIAGDNPSLLPLRDELTQRWGPADEEPEWLEAKNLIEENFHDMPATPVNVRRLLEWVENCVSWDGFHVLLVGFSELLAPEQRAQFISDLEGEFELNEIDREHFGLDLDDAQE